MTLDYPLEDLSPRAFEQLSVALTIQTMGPGVSAFGSGPDGGREATYTGPVNWSATSGLGDESWNGYVVIQAKQRERSGTPRDNASWLKRQISDELKSWMDPDSNRGQFPSYLLFVTNVNLSSVPGSGGIDSVNEYAEDRRTEITTGTGRKNSPKKRGLKSIKVWHRDQVNGLLSVHSGVRSSFKSLITVGDLLSSFKDLQGITDPEYFKTVLQQHAMRTIATERWVSFTEAGGSGSDRQSVDQIIIDLKANQDAKHETTVLSEVMLRGSQVLKRSASNPPKHIVLTGQPGSGKSTITRFVTQLYRASFLEGEDTLSTTCEEVVTNTKVTLGRLNLGKNCGKRWPIRVNLANYADAKGPGGTKGLLRWLSEEIEAGSDQDFMPTTLKKWLKNWPSIIIMDGLDEVTSPEVRPEILDEIKNFVEELDVDDADVLILVTTRPTGYTERLMPQRFDQLDLQYLDIETALDYGRNITRRRLSDDTERCNALMAKFESQAADPAALRLMKTPLQVLIVTLILERFGTLPADRYQLFSKYFETIYDREASKATSLEPLLHTHRGVITDLHESVGLELQILSEQESDARAVLPRSELRRLANDRLLELGFERGSETDRITERILQAATDRLVLLVAAEDDAISFEVRSLQELMAARKLADGTDEDIKFRLGTLAPSPHWRNCWIFLAGKLFVEGPDHKRDLVVEVAETVDFDSAWPGWLYPVGPGLAANLLDDGLADSKPKWVERLISVALRSLTGNIPHDTHSIALGLSVAMTPNRKLRVRNALKEAYAGTPRSQSAASIMERMGDFGSPVPGAFIPKKFPKETESEVAIADFLTSNLELLHLDAQEALTLSTIMEEFKHVFVPRQINGQILPSCTDSSVIPQSTMEGLTTPELSATIRLLLGTLDPKDWQIEVALAHFVGPILTRRPLGLVINPQQ